MMKTILAPLSGTDCDKPALAAALRIAKADSGHIECVCVSPDVTAVDTQLQQAGLGGWMYLTTKLDHLEHTSRERAKSAHTNFIRFSDAQKIHALASPAASDMPTISWHEERGEEFGSVTRLSRYHDVIVMTAGAYREGGFSQDFLGAVVIASGCPVVLTPRNETTDVFKVIAIAWKDTPEAARAVASAMPLLHSAERIEVVSAVESQEAEGDFAQSCDRLVDYLRWHGLLAKLQLLNRQHESTADAILASARNAGADLLVMGAYGHSRVREIIFGGFTERVLKGIEIPVLLAR